MRRVEINPAEQICLPLHEGDCVTVTDRTEHPVGEINFTSRTALVHDSYAMRHLLIPMGRDWKQLRGGMGYFVD